MMLDSQTTKVLNCRGNDRSYLTGFIVICETTSPSGVITNPAGMATKSCRCDHEVGTGKVVHFFLSKNASIFVTATYNGGLWGHP